jgi:hypothetical protein
MADRRGCLSQPGGDQSDYLSQWVGTSMQALLREKVAAITVGGTSAGCDILGQYIYSAEGSSVVSGRRTSGLEGLCLARHVEGDGGTRSALFGSLTVVTWLEVSALQPCQHRLNIIIRIIIHLSSSSLI